MKAIICRTGGRAPPVQNTRTPSSGSRWPSGVVYSRAPTPSAERAGHWSNRRAVALTGVSGRCWRKRRPPRSRNSAVYFGGFLLVHRAHPLRVLLSGKPGAVHSAGTIPIQTAGQHRQGVAKYQALKHTCQACPSRARCCPTQDHPGRA